MPDLLEREAFKVPAQCVRIPTAHRVDAWPTAADLYRHEEVTAVDHDVRRLVARVGRLEVVFGVEGALPSEDDRDMPTQVVLDHGLDHVAPGLSPILTGQIAFVVAKKVMNEPVEAERDLLEQEGEVDHNETAGRIVRAGVVQNWRFHEGHEIPPGPWGGRTQSLSHCVGRTRT